MDIPEPIELLKEKLKLMKKAIDKCTVSNCNSVSTNLNPLIKLYEDAIDLLEYGELRTEHYKNKP